MGDRVKIADISVNVAIRGSGGIVRERMIDFEVFKDGHFIAIPKLSLEERRVANLPPELLFEIHDGKVTSVRSKKDGNLDVLKDLASLLKDDPQHP